LKHLLLTSQGSKRNEAPRSSLLRQSSHFGYEGRKLRGIRLKFTDELKKVVIELGKSGLTASDEKALEEAHKKLAGVRD
jgi:hypothetical protein